MSSWQLASGAFRYVRIDMFSLSLSPLSLSPSLYIYIYIQLNVLCACACLCAHLFTHVFSRSFLTDLIFIVLPVILLQRLVLLPEISLWLGGFNHVVPWFG